MIWQLLELFRGELSAQQSADLLIDLAAWVFVLLFCVSVHECAHAWAAKKLGDDTAWMHGRLTLNPAKHLDFFGSMMILVAGFGYAKPVPVNPRKFKDRKKGMALTAAAGPLSNLAMAVVLLFVGQLFGAAVSLIGGLNADMTDLLWNFFVLAAAFNIRLMLFNLLPIPPLDGSRILDMILPYKVSMLLSRIERFSFIIAIAVAFIFSAPLLYLTRWILYGIHFLTGLPFFWVEAII